MGLRLRRGGKGRRQRDECTGVEVKVWPAVTPMTDARRERVVHGRVAQCASGTDPRQRVDTIYFLDGALEADDRIEAQQRNRDARVIQVDEIGRASWRERVCQYV